MDCWFDESGILISESKPAERNRSNYKQLFGLYRQLSEDGEKKIRVLGDITKTQELPKEVRDYINGELPKYIKAMALVSDSAMGRAIGNFFIMLSPHQFPVRLFPDKERASEWLKKY